MQEDLLKRIFIAPDGSNKAGVLNMLHEVLEQVVSFAAQANLHTPLPVPQKTIPDFSIPLEGLSHDTLMDQLNDVIHASMNPAHTGYLGHMDSIPAVYSVIGDLVASPLNNNMLSLEMSPVFSRLEQAVVKEFARRFGLGSQANGVLLSGGTLANLQALAVARNHLLQCAQTGLTHSDKMPVIFASQAAHSSIQKAAMLLGIGTEGVVSVNTNQQGQMDVSDLIQKLDMAVQHKQKPFCIVATAGTTVTGNIDPLGELAAVAKNYGCWFHVDAAYGGALIFSNSCHQKLEGIEKADSVTFNPQKWLYVAKTCAMVLFKDETSWKHAFEIKAPYMKENTDFTDLGQISVQGTRHADILKLWLALQHIGGQNFEYLIHQAFQLTSFFRQQIKARPFLSLATEPELNIICFRAEPDNVSVEKQDALNIRLQEFLLKEKRIFLSLPTYQNKPWLRAVLLNPFTDENKIHELFKAIDEYGFDHKLKLD
jgi:glutamate/tyrosine decarboxylase-like PLP-dependent enzyme